MKNKIISTILIAIILTSTFLIIPFSFSATEEEIEASIDARAGLLRHSHCLR